MSGLHGASGGIGADCIVIRTTKSSYPLARRLRNPERKLKMDDNMSTQKSGLADSPGSASGLKRGDQKRLLQASLKFTEGGAWEGLFTYPNCGWDLVQMGLANEDKTITKAGRAALWLLELGDDPTDSKATEEFTLSLPNDTAHSQKGRKRGPDNTQD